MGRHWRADEEEEEEKVKMFRNGGRNGIRKKILILERESWREKEREKVKDEERGGGEGVFMGEN